MRVHHRQSVAEHSYFVASYSLGIADFIDWKGNREDLVRFALRHDEDEAITGDIPGPVKRLGELDYGKLDEVTDQIFEQTTPIEDAEQVVAIAQVAGLLDECLYLAGEMNMGNRHVGMVFINSKVLLMRAIDGLPTTMEGKQKLAGFLRDIIDSETNAVKSNEGFNGV
jgi:5'-deoxynucleotidase YfbR-like HD superfamily hydrolase